MVAEVLQRREIGCLQIKQHLLLLSDECESAAEQLPASRDGSQLSVTSIAQEVTWEERDWWLLVWGRGDAKGGGVCFLN